MNISNESLANRSNSDPFKELLTGVYSALETYSNVHRGSGHSSLVSTHLYDQAREIVLDYLGLKNSKYFVVFCTAKRVEAFTSSIEPENYKTISSQEFGLHLGVYAIALKKTAMPKGVPSQTGGGTTRLYSREWVIWANEPDKFEAGTPAIINIIAFAKALKMIKMGGSDIFLKHKAEQLSVDKILNNDELNELSGIDLLNKLRQNLIGANVLVPGSKGLIPFINLDNSASTPTFVPVFNAFANTLVQSKHVHFDMIPKVKTVCSEFFGAPLSAYDVIFTSNTSESINLSAESLGLEPQNGEDSLILTTFLEHSSNDLPWRTVPNHSLIRLKVDNDGFWDLDEIDNILSSYNLKHEFGKKRIKLVAVSGASNVLGSCNNLAELSLIVHKYGARLFVDGAQLAAHRKINMDEWGLDYLAFSAHKVYAPFGCGALIVKRDLLISESRELVSAISSGEENPAGIAALGKSLSLLNRIGFDVIKQEERALTIKALKGMSVIPDLKIQGISDPDSPKFSDKIGVIAFEIKNKMNGSIAKKLAYNSGIGIRYGCHCAHLIVKQLSGFTPFLENLQRYIVKIYPPIKLQGFARISFGIENSESDVDKLLFELNNISKDKKAEKKQPELKKSEVKKQIETFIKERAKIVYED